LDENGLDYQMKFTHQHKDGTKIKIEMLEEPSIDAVLEEFQNFLRACGYVMDYNSYLVLEGTNNA
jgi:hypothetical protein